MIGCLLDVSGSMSTALESGNSKIGTDERLEAVVRAALKFLEAGKYGDSEIWVFVAAFGVSDELRTSTVDLCGIAESLLQTSDRDMTGHDRLVRIANQRNVSYVEDYIRTKLSTTEAIILATHLQRYPEQIQGFVNAIPPQFAVAGVGWATAVSGYSSEGVSSWLNDKATENSAAIKMARKVCIDWWQQFSEFMPRPVADVVGILRRLQEHTDTANHSKSNARNEQNLLNMLRPYLYGSTPMVDALTKSKKWFQWQKEAQHQVLLLVSDGCSTDGDPRPVAASLRKEGVKIATTFLTSSLTAHHRRIYDRADLAWNAGQTTLFEMASTVPVSTHPIPVLTTLGWAIPSSGECSIYATVSSTLALEEFCSALLSARFGSADVLLDLVGRVRIDSYVNDEYVRICKRPSDQGSEGTCYAHATAAIIHMALLRIVMAPGVSHSSISTIRNRILTEFPPNSRGYSVKRVMEKATVWYHPLQFCEVNEDGARQAVLRRRPVLTTFRLSKPGWHTFSRHFETDTTRSSILTKTHMEADRKQPDDGGHGVILTGCAPDSLTFLNSWGLSWGAQGSFMVEDHAVLEIDNAAPLQKVHFYDVFWHESSLTTAQRNAYSSQVDEALRTHAGRNPGIQNFEMYCPQCRRAAPITTFSGSVRCARCPLCQQTFLPEPGHLMQALYLRAGLSGASGP